MAIKSVYVNVWKKGERKIIKTVEEFLIEAIQCKKTVRREISAAGENIATAHGQLLTQWD